jgi:hypothetical protein
MICETKETIARSNEIIGIFWINGRILELRRISVKYRDELKINE